MRFQKSQPIHKAASKDAGRYSIHCVYLDPDPSNGRLVATNGRILAVIPCDAESNESGIIPLEAMELACKGSKKTFPAGHIEMGSAETVEVVSPTARSTFERPDVEFPNWRAVVPNPTDYPLSLTLNPFLLQKLAAALGQTASNCEGVTLHLRIDPSTPAGIQRLDDSSPVRVTLPKDSDSFGVIMPIEEVK